MERIDDLQLKGLKILQDTELFCFGTDAVLLADFVRLKKNARVADLGTGTGILPLLLYGRQEEISVQALELQERLCNIARRSVRMNGLEDRIEVLRGDIKEARSLLYGEFDAVVSNPPYEKEKAGIQSTDESHRLARFAKRKVVTLWLPVVAANTVYTLLTDLFLKVNILTGDERILDLPGNLVTTPVTIKDIIGRTAHWSVFDGGTQLGGAMWFIQALFQISLLYAGVEFLLKKLLRSGDTLIPQGLLAGVLLWLGWQAQRIGWNVWGLGIAASCYCLFYLGVVLHRVQHPHGPARGALCCSGAFVVLLVLGQFGSVGLAGNSYPGPLYLLAASLAGWMLVYEGAHLLARVPAVSGAFSALGRATMPIVILHFLAFKPVTWLGLLATGGESYLLAAFPIYFTSGAWWVAYTAAGLALPLLAYAVWVRLKKAVRRG